MRIAAIDIGTNTILTLIADVTEQGELSVVRDEHAIARLGEGVDKNHLILSHALERAISILVHHRAVIDASSAERIVAFGTSALRLASNREEVLAAIRNRVGIEVEVISGELEAELTYSGAISPFLSPTKSEEFLVIDIGGGSTELTCGVNLAIRSRMSIDVGSVRLSERFLRTAPPGRHALESARSFVQSMFSRLERHSIDRAIGVAGTLTTLAALDMNLPTFDPVKVGGHTLSHNTVRTLLQKLGTMTRTEIARLPQVVAGREDIILAGVLILDTLMAWLELSEITVSERGLRYGMALRAGQLR